jgi:hypothetical protein
LKNIILLKNKINQKISNWGSDKHPKFYLFIFYIIAETS